MFFDRSSFSFSDKLKLFSEIETLLKEASEELEKEDGDFYGVIFKMGMKMRIMDDEFLSFNGKYISRLNSFSSPESHEKLCACFSEYRKELQLLMEYRSTLTKIEA